MYTYRGQMLEAHDGDTFRLLLDLGLGTRHADADLGFDIKISGHRVRLTEDVRLYGCNAIELAQPGGQEARDHLLTLLPVGTWATVETIKNDKYSGRYDAKVTLPDGSDLTARMIADGYAAPYDGTGVKAVPPWPIPAKAS